MARLDSGEGESRIEPPGTSVASQTRTLQVASFRESDRAERQVRELKKKGYTCYSLASVHPENRKAYYRVFVGPFSNEENAREIKEKLEINGGFRDILMLSGDP
jgi:cell division septation protein DedD